MGTPSEAVPVAALTENFSPAYSGLIRSAFRRHSIADSDGIRSRFRSIRSAIPVIRSAIPLIRSAQWLRQERAVMVAAHEATVYAKNSRSSSAPQRARLYAPADRGCVRSVPGHGQRLPHARVARGAWLAAGAGTERSRGRGEAGRTHRPQRAR